MSLGAHTKSHRRAVHSIGPFCLVFVLNFSILRYHLGVLVPVARGVVPLTSSGSSVAGENNKHDQEFFRLTITQVRSDLQNNGASVSQIIIPRSTRVATRYADSLSLALCDSENFAHRSID